MKKYLNIILGIAAVSLLVASCAKEKEVFTPGDPDVAGCQGVYFPSQEASGSHIYDPDMAKTLEVQVARSTTSGSITVPVVVAETADGETVSGVFNVAPITFADGQKETTVLVSFPNITGGVNYGLTLTIADPQYASNYKEGAISFDFDVLCVKWEDFLNPKTGEKAIVHWSQGWWGETVDTYLKYYDVNGVRTLVTETIPDTHVYNGAGYTAYGFFGTCENPGEGEWTLTWYTKDKNSKGGEFIKLNKQWTYYNTNYSADVIANDYFCHYAWVNPGSYADYEPNWLAYALKYGDPGSGQDLSYYDGNGGFYLSVFRYYMAGVGGWNPGFYDLVGIAEGFDRPDYSLELEASDPENFVTTVTATAGSTVSYIMYDVFEGAMNDSQIESKSVEMIEDNLGTKVEFGEERTAEMEVSGETTGKYTLIAVVYGPDVETGEIKAQGYNSIIFNVESENDPQAVDVNCGIEAVPQSQITLDGANPENSLQYYVYGSGLTDVKVAAFKYLDVVSKGVDACKEATMGAKSLPAAAIAAVNDGGYKAIMTGLLPGTEYYLFVYGTNGFEKKVVMSEMSATTSGDPLPIYQSFDIDSYDPDAELESAADWCTTWNYYATDWYGTTGMREYLGKVKITASDTETEGPDDYGYYDEYVLVDGLFPNAVVDGPAYGYEVGTCVLEMDVYAGCMYSFADATYDGICRVDTYSPVLQGGGWFSKVHYYGAFVPVDDGYYAFVDTEGTYNFHGLRVVMQYVWDAFLDMLLVDPAKDDNGLAPKNIEKKIFEAQKRFAEASKEVTLTGNAKQDIHNIIDRYNQKTVKNWFQPVGKIMPRDAKSANVNVNVKMTTKAASQQEKPAFKLGPVAFGNTSRLN